MYHMFARPKGGIFMTLRHMKIFVSVYQNNGITRASEELHLAQPSVSLAIRELEDYYGIRLFDPKALRHRTGKDVLRLRAPHRLPVR